MSRMFWDTNLFIYLLDKAIAPKRVVALRERTIERRDRDRRLGSFVSYCFADVTSTTMDASISPSRSQILMLGAFTRALLRLVLKNLSTVWTTLSESRDS